MWKVWRSSCRRRWILGDGSSAGFLVSCSMFCGWGLEIFTSGCGVEKFSFVVSSSTFFGLKGSQNPHPVPLKARDKGGAPA